MRILITGAGGFVGRHLSRHLKANSPDSLLYGTVFTENLDDLNDGVSYHQIDLKDQAKVIALLDEIRPDHIYHLAAQSSVAYSFNAPWETLENNILSQLNLFLACIELDIKPRILIVSSAEIYGAVEPNELPVTEQSELRPNNPYSVSKITQDMMAYQYYKSHNMKLIRARSFNHFGPGQTERFVAPAFAMQVARIEAGLQEPVMKVGNLSAERDFTDVRDMVQAYHQLMSEGRPGEVYNIASGTAHSAQSILDTLLANSTASVQVEVDPERLRPVEVPVIYGSPARIQAHTGWKPQISFKQSVVDILNDCRSRIQK